MKEGADQHPPYKKKVPGTLLVFSYIAKGLSPSDIWNKNTMSQDQVKKALLKLKDAGFIIKRGYGTWENTVAELTEEMLERRCLNVHRVALLHTPPKSIKPDTDRMHGAVAVVKIKKLKNWDRRENLFTKKNPKTGKPYLDFRKIPQGQCISFMDIKNIWLCNRSLVFYLPFSWFADTAKDAIHKATNDLITIIKRLERNLYAIDAFKWNEKGYKIKFSRQQHALIKNALAQQYDKDKKKLSVYDEKGLWLIIDNSYNLHELETVHPETSPDDNEKVQNFFNELKGHPTPEKIFDTGKDISEFKSMLQGTVQNNLASSNALMWLGSAMKNQTGSLTRQTDILEGVYKLLSGVKDKLHSLASTEHIEPSTPLDEDIMVKVSFLKNYGAFWGILRGNAVLYDPKRIGQTLYVSKHTAKALLNNQIVKLINFDDKK